MTTSTLVLYDTTGQWGWLGELYAIMSANLASHFGSWTAMPVASYQAGQLKQYTAAIYIGSTYDDPAYRVSRRRVRDDDTRHLGV
jgi:hypothetical protein